MEPKILLLDLETTPIEAYTWGPKWENNLIEVIRQSMILSYSAKWLDGKHITKGWPDYDSYKIGQLNDKAIVDDLWHLIDEADFIVAQNGRDFDVKVMNARFIFHKLPPPSPYKVIDPKLEAKKYLRLPSYSLNDICDYYGIGRKMEHEGFPLWKACMSGDKKAWKRMLAYNKKDVVLMEELYLMLRPWMKTHPNRSVHEGMVCPKCGSIHIHSRGVARSQTAVYNRYQCQDCGGWCRSTKSDPENSASITNT